MNAVIYYTEIPEEYENKKMEHMFGEKLLEEGLKREYGLDLKFEPRARGEHGKPFFTLQPKIHYNIRHSGKYVVCVLAGSYLLLDLEPGYSGAVWSADPLELRWEHVNVQLP